MPFAFVWLWVDHWPCWRP